MCNPKTLRTLPLSVIPRERKIETVWLRITDLGRKAPSGTEGFGTRTVDGELTSRVEKRWKLFLNLSEQIQWVTQFILEVKFCSNSVRMGLYRSGERKSSGKVRQNVNIRRIPNAWTYSFNQPQICVIDKICNSKEQNPCLI